MGVKRQDGVSDRIRWRASDVPLAWSKLQAQRPAFYSANRTISYGQFSDAIRSATACLAARGVLPGDRVAIIGLNSFETAVFLFASHELDAWPALLNARLSPREVDECIAFSGARVAIFATDDASEAALHAERWKARYVRLPSLSFAIASNDKAGAPEVIAGTDEDIAALIFTSGTTGSPKAVMLSHRVLRSLSIATEKYGIMKADDVLYGVAPFAHVIGLGTVLMNAMTVGAAVELAPRFDPALLAQSIAAGRVTRIIGVPVIYARLLEHIAEHKVDISHHRLRGLTCGGAPLDVALKERVETLFGLPLTNGYGCTECSPIARGDISAGNAVAGEAFDGVEIEVVRDGSAVAPGEVGEIWVRGPFMMSGYYKNPEATAEVMRDGGWLATGDLGKLGEDRRLTIVGRQKELIIRSGFNVYPVEVETVLNSHPSIYQSAVIGRPLPDQNEEVVAFVELAPNTALDHDELRHFISDRLAPYKKPARTIALERLPLGPTGKIDKLALRRLLDSDDVKALADA